MQAGGRLVEDVKRATGRAPREFLGELDALRLTAGESRRRLAEVNVIEADVAQRFELLPDRRNRTEKLDRVEHGHVEHLGNILALVLNLERVAIVAFAAADLAGDVNVGQKMHLDANDAVALARLAAAALDVERKSPRPVTAHARLGQLRKQLADMGKQTGVSRGIRARRAPDGALIDVNDLVEMLDALERLVRTGALAAVIQFLRERAIHRVEHQCRFAGTRNAGDAGEDAERNRHGEIAQIVLPRALDGQPAAGELAASRGHRNLDFA